MKLLIAFLAIAMIGITSASTVTLTGTCRAAIVNRTNNYISFGITNSGNGTATNLLIEPLIDGATVKASNATISIPLVAPGASYSENVYISNFTIPGSYVARFVARYSQGSSTFETIFPCLVSLGQSAQSILAVTNISSKSGNMSVIISNIADYPIMAQVSVYAPPEFSVAIPAKNVTLDSYGTTKVSFAVSQPQFTDAEFPIAVGVSYVNSSIRYSSLAITTIKFGASSGGSPLAQLGGSLIVPASIAVILAIVALIIISIVANGRKKHRRQGQDAQANDGK
ncbi:MAG: CARDB domain-containing protein [Candidatus Micrarchaeaceae archaeon]